MRIVRASTAFVLALAMASGCGGGGGGDDGDDGGDPPDAALPGDHYSLTWGPITVDPLAEDTRCVTLLLSNAAPIKVHALHNNLGETSHHFIVYRDNSNAPVNETPTPCEPFAGTLDPAAGATPIIITQRADETLMLPDGVAYSFAANQKIRLEMHYINNSDVPAEVTSTAEFYVIPDAEVQHEADFLFIGSPDISFTLQPGASQMLRAYFPLTTASPALDGVDIFAITGHTHKHGTDMDIWTSPSATGPDTEIYNPTPYNWDEPETRMHVNPFLRVPSGGGFDFMCEWTNNTSSAVSIEFGESANQEMCFFWAYYFPSHGAKVCVHTDQFGGVDACCPDAGPTICGFISGG
jgi:hypothetical protein